MARLPPPSCVPKARLRHRGRGRIAAVEVAYRENALRLYAGLGVRLMLVGNDPALTIGALRQRADLVAGLD